ncbi:MAG: flagellar FliJ family protein [Immundisolibacteraceae bacterium]|nr:flagellar FliJ family protein [Immundisolibacteraceae bacterium]
MNLGKSRTRRLKLLPIIKLKQLREREAGERLQQIEQDRTRRQQLVEKLEGYRENYLVKMDQALNEGMPMLHLTDYRGMVAQIESALDKEATALKWAQSDWQLAHKAWQTAHSQVDALSELSDRYQRHGMRVEENLEEEQQDDFQRGQSPISSW